MLYTHFKKNHKEIDLDEILNSNKIIKFKEGNKILLKDLKTKKIKMDDIETIEIKPFLLKDNKYYIVCPYCHEIHNHGAIEGHRVAHCTTQNKILNDYFIKL